MNTGHGDVIAVRFFGSGNAGQISLVGDSWEMPLCNRAAFDLALQLLAVTREDGPDWVMRGDDKNNDPDGLEEDLSDDALEGLMNSLEQAAKENTK